MEGTMKCPANYVPLSPISFLERAAIVFGNRTSIVYGDVSYTWQQTRERCVRLASALSQLGVSRRDVVAALAPNVPALCELHFGAPMAGGVLCAINTYFDAKAIASALGLTKPKVLFVDYEFLPVAEKAITLLSSDSPLIVTIQDHGEKNPQSHNSDHPNYEDLLSSGNPNFEIIRPDDEFEPIALNFTSGTTANPKCSVYSHRGAYLNSSAVLVITEMRAMPVYLWTVPIFHCSGWCSVWAVAAAGGVNVCLREVNAKVIFDNVVKHKVTHFGASPALLNVIGNATESEKKTFPWTVEVMTGGAPAAPEIIMKLMKLGFRVSSAYGCTESYGAGAMCVSLPEWDSLPEEEAWRLKARQGLHHFAMEAIDVMDPDTMQPVPLDGKTIGEIVFRGNTIMCGYFKNPEATKTSFRGGWYWTRDMGVRHPDGYIQLKDRSQDVIVTGGEMVGSTEIEALLFCHPAVFEAAVVGRPDEALGESLCAFVSLKQGFEATEEDIIEFCGKRLADEYGDDHEKMVPKTVVFTELPKTSTGKTQKYVLRQIAKQMGSVPKTN